MKIFNILNKILISLILIFSIFFIVGVSYSFFTSGISGSETDTTLTVETGDMKLVYYGGPDITALSIVPSIEPFATKEFTLTGTSTISNRDMVYELSLIIDENTFSENAISYTIEGTNNANNGYVVSELERQNINSGNIVLGKGKFSGVVTNALHSYTLKLYFYETFLNQSIDMGKTFKAHVSVDEASPIPLSSYLMTLVDTEQGTGMFINEYGYRYEGLDPNNYVLFNNETWRIIGIFDEATHGRAGENLVKIIRPTSIGNIAWQKPSPYHNDWNTSSLKVHLNGTYYNEINESSRNMIENVTWKLGGASSYGLKAQSYYSDERGTTAYSGNTTSGEGYIGLMYPSDYGFAVLASTCPRTTGLSSYTNNGCYNQTWINNSDVNGERFITHLSHVSDSTLALRQKKLSSMSSSYSGQVRPVLYLKSDIFVVNGKGTIGNPYVID